MIVRTNAHGKESAWNGYRRRRLALWITVPFWALPTAILSLFSKPPELLVGVLFLPVVVSASLLQFFKCPRCGSNFFYRSVWSPWAHDCVHCGLPKWEDGGYTADLVGKPFHRGGVYPTPRETRPPPDPAIARRDSLALSLSLVLRDDPPSIGLQPDGEGWVDTSSLIARAGRAGIPVSLTALEDLLAAPQGETFEHDPSGTRIRFRR